MNKQTIIALFILAVVALSLSFLMGRLNGTRMTHMLAADAYPLYSSFTWGVEHPQTAEGMQGFEVVSAPVTNVTDLASVFQGFETYYREKLAAAGWSVENSLAADGPGGSLTVYRKGNDYLALTYHSTFNGPDTGGPAQCPCDMTFSVFSGSTPAAASVKDATYEIGGAPVTLVNGVAAVPSAPGSASMTTTTYFGNEATGDLNGDGTPDTAFILTQSGGGSGTFYYAVAALNTPEGYQGTDAVFLGDRIAPQTTEIRNGEIIVNYATRAPTEPMTAQPSMGVSKYLKVSGYSLVDAGN